MPAITIKNIPEKLYERLKVAANIHHRSINSELIVNLEKALMPEKEDPQNHIEEARKLRKMVKATRLSAMDINDAKNKGRL